MLDEDVVSNVCHVMFASGVDSTGDPEGGFRAHAMIVSGWFVGEEEDVSSWIMAKPRPRFAPVISTVIREVDISIFCFF